MALNCTDDVYIADTARVLGDVQLGPRVSIWYGAVVRGDVGTITIGAGTNVQDNAVIHCDFGRPNTIGENVTIAHGALVHGIVVGDETLIGIGAVVLGEVTIGTGCLIAAGALVPPGMNVPDGMLVMGVPGKIVRPTTDHERQQIRASAEQYIALARQHVQPATDDACNPPAPRC